MGCIQQKTMVSIPKRIVEDKSIRGSLSTAASPLKKPSKICQKIKKKKSHRENSVGIEKITSLEDLLNQTKRDHYLRRKKVKKVSLKVMYPQAQDGIMEE